MANKYLDYLGLQELVSNIKNIFAPKDRGIEYIRGTWTEASGTWTGVSKDSTLYDGKQIILYMPYAGSGNATLNLTLADGTTTGAKNVYFENTTRFTTHKAQNSQLHLIYHSAQTLSNGSTYEGWWFIANRDTNDTATIIGYPYGSYKTKTALYRYQVLLTIDETTLVPVNAVNNSTATTKTLTTESFNPFGQIYYYNSTATVNANGAVGNLRAQQLIDLRISFNTGTTLIANKSVYLACVPQNDGLVKLHSTPIVQSLPTSEDGLVYIYLGQAYDTYRITMHVEKPVYWFKNGKVREYTDKDVVYDANYVHTDNNFTDTEKSKLSGIAAGAQVNTITGVKGDAESSYRTGDVNITAANIGAFEKLNYAEGTLEVGIRPYIDQARANRLAFLPPDQIIIEKTTDGGTTWVDAGITDASKRNLFSEINATDIFIPLLNGEKSTQCGLRITITGMKYYVPEGTLETEKYNYWNSNYINKLERYFNVREWWFWISSNNDRIRPEIYCASGQSPDNWTTVFNADFRMSGWSGSDWVRAGGGKTFGGNTSQTWNYWNWRLIFWSTPVEGHSTFDSATQQSIQQIRCYGDNVWGTPNNLMNRDHLYSWDRFQNVSFPANVTAVQFNGNATSATNASTVNNHTVNTDVPANAVFTDTVTTVATTGSGNAITSLSASNGAITATKDSTFLTSISSTDVTNALGFTPLTTAQTQAMIDAAISNIVELDEVNY